jgi:hypothetical protein
MAKSIVGVYETPEETMNAIEGLTSRGYDTDEIAVITNRRDTDYLEERTGAEVANADVRDNEHDESFWDKLKDYFTMNNEYDRSNQLSNMDIPEDELDSYTTELNDGKFILAVDEAAAAFISEDSTLGDSAALETVDNRSNSDFGTENRVLGDTTLGDTVSLGSYENTADPIGTSGEAARQSGRTSMESDTRETANENNAFGGSTRNTDTSIDNADFHTTRSGIDREDDTRAGDSTFGAGKLNDEVTGIGNSSIDSTEEHEGFNKTRSTRFNTSDSLNSTGPKEEQVGKDVETVKKEKVRQDSDGNWVVNRDQTLND